VEISYLKALRIAETRFETAVSTNDFDMTRSSQLHQPIGDKTRTPSFAVVHPDVLRRSFPPCLSMLHLHL
jgi:hypothetical protein